jgi:putative transposase
VVVVWDNGAIHKAVEVREVCRDPRLRLESLPPYAPELNPIEPLWAFAKGALANGCPSDTTDLLGRLLPVFYGVARSPTHLRGFIRRSDLSPFFT